MTMMRQFIYIVECVIGGYKYDPGDSDLDDEQPISVCMTLGQYRAARNLIATLKERNML